ncbi:hypothetical protein RvY_08989 [Ramazzottius varieornatus]|uniref:Uncharacterized protein n=1 Tax=Ramazzottius varieornatus TaxID=947166 RepID=A0A1D1VGZ5_RAMVA|nr:hypothetical protein RvY_08989 [Ramazzottius varieornatus]
MIGVKKAIPSFTPGNRTGKQAVKDCDQYKPNISRYQHSLIRMAGGRKDKTSNSPSPRMVGVTKCA